MKKKQPEPGALDTLRYVLAIVIVGVLGAAFAILFRLALGEGYRVISGERDVLAMFRALPPLARMLLPPAGAFVAGSLAVLATRRGAGVGEVMEAVVLGRGRISAKNTLWKGLASLFATIGGGSLGREGPIIQAGAAAGAHVGERLGLDPHKVRALIAAGTAAGFAAAYNTPIAAVLFVLEIVTGLFTLDIVLPVVVATAIATSLTRITIGGGPIYGLRSFSVVSSAEYALYLSLGALAGIVGPWFMATLALGERFFHGLSLPRPVRAALGGLGVGLIAIVLPEITGNGFETIQVMLDEHLAAKLLLVLLVAKILATVLSVSSGSPGGVFTPTLFIGAALGGEMGNAIQGLRLFGGQAQVGGYALVGMAAMTASTTHAPIMAAVLVFELSGDYAVVLPLILATTVATLIARKLRPDSIYTEELRRRGIPWEGTLTEKLARAVRARDIMEPVGSQVAPSTPIDQALSSFEHGRERIVWVTSEDKPRAIDLHKAKEIWLARARGEPTPQAAGEASAHIPLAHQEDTLMDLAEKLFEVDFGEIPVVDRKRENEILGVVTRRALLGAFDRELLQRDVLLTRAVWSDGQTSLLELPRGHEVEIIDAPGAVVGRELDCATVRKSFKVTVLAVRRRQGHEIGWIDPDDAGPLRERDRLLVVGPRGEIERFAASR